MTIDEVLRLRLRAQRLDAQKPAAPEKALGAVFAVQAQELPAARLALRARSAGLTAAEVDAARQERGAPGSAIVWTWALRGTLHLLTAGDAAWLVPFLGPRLVSGDGRRMRQLGWDEAAAAQGIKTLEAALEKRGPLARAEISQLLKQRGLPHEGQAPIHLLYRMAMECTLVRGADKGKEPAYTLWNDWLGPPRPLPPDEALARLARRYLEAYAPAGAADLAAWAGLPAGEARRALEAIRGELEPVDLAGKAGWMLQGQLPWLDDPPNERVVRLLPRYDAYLLGYAGRAQALPAQHAKKIHPGGGILHAALLADGRILGTWKLGRRGKAHELTVEPFGPLPAWARPALEAEAADIGRFLGVDIVLVEND